jgi:hypothetical protein
MGIAVGILALICALVLLFGRRGTRKILGWSLSLTVLGAVCAVVAIWAIEHNKQTRLLSDAEVGIVGQKPAWTSAPIVVPAPATPLMGAARLQMGWRSSDMQMNTPITTTPGRCAIAMATQLDVGL